MKLDLNAQAYVAIWKTKGAGLNPAKTYRIQVLVGTQVLGCADVVVLSNGSQIKTVDKNQIRQRDQWRRAADPLPNRRRRGDPARALAERRPGHVQPR